MARVRIGEIAQRTAQYAGAGVQATGALYAFPTIASYLAAASGSNPFAYVLSSDKP